MDQSATIQQLRERALIDLAQHAALAQRVNTHAWVSRLARKLTRVEEVLRPRRIELVGAMIARLAAAHRQPTFEHRSLEEVKDARELLVNCLLSNLADVDLAHTPAVANWSEVLDWFFVRDEGGLFEQFLRDLQEEACAKGYELVPAEAGEPVQLVYRKLSETRKDGPLEGAGGLDAEIDPTAGQ